MVPFLIPKKVDLNETLRHGKYSRARISSVKQARCGSVFRPVASKCVHYRAHGIAPGGFFFWGKGQTSEGTFHHTLFQMKATRRGSRILNCYSWKNIYRMPFMRYLYRSSHSICISTGKVHDVNSWQCLLNQEALC